uniref:Secreted protein n=1 Tax=Ascaris lumbricoides TaxID=6252 RepID=A0A0M3HZB8_ASCLU
MCQLSSGRIFLRSGSDKLCQMGGINDLCLMLISNFNEARNEERTDCGMLFRLLLITTGLPATGFCVGRMSR